MAKQKKTSTEIPNRVDPNIPTWVCHKCRHPLSIVSADSYADKFLLDSTSRSASSLHGAGSVLASTHIDNSFFVLPKQKSQSQSPGLPPRPRGGAVHPQMSQMTTYGKSMEESFVVLPPDHSFVVLPKQKSQSQSPGLPPRPQGGAAAVHPQMTSYGKSMEESFVVLPPARDSVYTSESASGTEGANAHLHPNASGFHATITALSQAFHIATSQTHVEQPLCLECMKVLSDKLDKEVEDIERDIKAYDACLQRVESEARVDLSEADFLKEKRKIEEEERKLEAAIAETEKCYAEVNAELEELELKSNRLQKLEDRYWHEFNNFQFQLISHQEKRDAILAEIEVSLAHLELLKRTNVLNDAFPIWHDRELGTINNFRLGRLPKVLVEWDEINAAWGQACLLLHTICQHFMPKFHYRIKILPMGSYPRIMDTSNNTYELFGPVNLFWSTRYDKAMTLYLTCLKDLAEFARIKDLENNTPPDKCFKFPYKIENDKVETYSITQSYKGQENWTKALKCTLYNLKWVLSWFVCNTDFQPLTGEAPSQTEFPSLAGSHTRRPGSSRVRPDSRKPSGS